MGFFRALAAPFILVLCLCACAIKPLSPDAQKQYFSSRIIDWQLSAATKCLGRAQSYPTPPPAEQTAKWRAYGEAAFQKFPFGGPTTLDDLIGGIAATQTSLRPSARHQLDRACAVVPNL